MTMGIDLYKTEVERLYAQRAALANQMMQQQAQLGASPPLLSGQLGQIYGMGIVGGAAERELTKEERYQRELRALKTNVAGKTDLILGVLLGIGIVIGGSIALLGLKTVAITVLSIMGVLGAYFGLHKAVFAYHKRKFELEQATKAMLE